MYQSHGMNFVLPTHFGTEEYLSSPSGRRPGPVIVTMSLSRINRVAQIQTGVERDACKSEQVGGAP
jgi:hypothetical protein